MKKWLSLFFLSTCSIAQANECIPAKEFVPYPKGTNIGLYQRIHPNGEYVLHSSMYSSRQINSTEPVTKVQMYNLNKRNANGEAEVTMTPMNDEVYPVMTDWSLFASPNHNDGMRYFTLDQILSQKQNAGATFSDRSHNEYYQSVGELEGSTPESKKIRVTLYSGRRTKDYEIKYKDGKPETMTAAKEGRICDNVANPPKNSLPREEVEKLRQDSNRLSAKLDELSIKFGEARTTAEQERIRTEYMNIQNQRNALNAKLGIGRIYEFSSPVLSHDGSEVAAQSNAPIDPKDEGTRGSNYTQKIYKINSDYSCELVEDLGFQTQKIQFSPPVKGKKGKVIFVGGFNLSGKSYTNGVYIYDRDTKKLQKITTQGEYRQLGYPGLTTDGRAIFPACKQTGNEFSCGSVIVDPNQIDPETGSVMETSDSCISKNSKGKATAPKEAKQRVEEERPSEGVFDSNK